MTGLPRTLGRTRAETPRAWNSTLPARTSGLRSNPGATPFTSFKTLGAPQRDQASRSGGRTPRPNPGRARNQARDTGFPPAVRLASRTRAGGGDPAQAACEAHGGFLGLHGGEMQHRRARGRGGSRDPLTSCAANAALLCHDCHMLAEARDPQMGPDGAGWWIWSWQSPLEIPVLLATADGGFRAWFTADGGYSTSAPGAAS